MTLPPSTVPQDDATWSPDGTHIVFVQGPASGGQLAALAVNQKNPQLSMLTAPGSDDHDPSFAPTTSPLLLAFVDDSFALLLCAVAICILVFAVAVRAASIESAHSPLCAYFIGAMTLSVAGVGLFAFPHPLHNVFGLSETVGYQAPLVMALTWRGEKRASSLATVSWVAFGLIWLAIALNLSAMDRHGELWAYVKPCYGLVQRALFAAWFGWLAVVGFLLFCRKIVPHHA